MIGFFLHESLGYSSSVIALAGAVLMVLVTNSDVEEAFKSVEWPVIFFFVGLFIIVGGLEEEGIMENLANGIIGVTHGDPMLTSMVLLWVSGIASAFLDNIPFVATMIPLLKAIGQSGHTSTQVFWWALSLGACLGGNGTLIGASANIIVAGTAQKQGYDLSFKKYFKIGFPMMILSMVLASLYLLIFYL
jgi:Na+/H+ antiporter NhaD/arsenite permease-like protein